MSYFRKLLVLWIVLLCITSSFFITGAESKEKLIIFHAGSLAIPFQEMAKAFNKKYLEVDILREASGSRQCARKVVDLGRECDVVAVADYTVNEQLLIPKHADWNINFATNEMAIMYRKDSKFAGEINAQNWPNILLRDKVEYGHSDPNTDPCGYRALMVWLLAEKYYEAPGLYNKLEQHCPPRNVRPKETDLIAMLEAGELDYLFIYRSVCEQHHMPFLILPDKVNLKTAEHTDFYRQASVKITGKKPGEWIEKKGAPMVYGITIPKNAPNDKTALTFVKFVISPEGQAIMSRNGQPPIKPPVVTGYKKKLPDILKSNIH
jgi:molybdate/tungstate transport system substrate-binding protein